MRMLLIASLLLISGCGVTRTVVTQPDGATCSSATYTLGKDISGGQFKGCNAEFGVQSSDPSQNMMNTINLLLPYALKAAMAPAP